MKDFYEAYYAAVATVRHIISFVNAYSAGTWVSTAS